ncbi:MAG: hypothetical protein ABSC55_26200 [Syntrophorhabdales bacterium]
MPKLMNIDEEVPSEFFIFVSQLNPMTYHNFNLIGQFSSGAFSSASLGPEYLQKYLKGEFRYLPYEPVQMDAMMLSPYFLTAINDYRIEYDAEFYRRKFYPFYPLRLSAIYAFGDYDSCVRVNRKYGWSLTEAYRFKLLDHPLNRVVKVNMEHVSLARHAYKVSMLQDIDKLWAGYWSGFDNLVLELPASGYQRKTYESGVVWEYLIEGAVQKVT